MPGLSSTLSLLTSLLLPLDVISISPGLNSTLHWSLDMISFSPSLSFTLLLFFGLLLPLDSSLVWTLPPVPCRCLFRCGAMHIQLNLGGALEVSVCACAKCYWLWIWVDIHMYGCVYLYFQHCNSALYGAETKNRASCVNPYSESYMLKS